MTPGRPTIFHQRIAIFLGPKGSGLNSLSTNLIEYDCYSLNMSWHVMKCLAGRKDPQQLKDSPRK